MTPYIDAAITGDKRCFAAPTRILVATDLTDGEYLIPHAVAQAKATDAAVTLVHAILPAETLPIDAGSVSYVDVAKVEQEVHASLLGMSEQIESHGVPCEVVSKHGFAADVIQEELRITGATRLIMASHGRGKLGQFMMGSVANQILGRVHVPVFLVGLRSFDSTGRTTPQRILHPVSLSGDYRNSVDLAIELSRIYKAELTLLHVADREMEKNIQPGGTLPWVENLFANMIPKGVNLDPPIQVTMAFGNLVDEIRKAAIRMETDWIVLGVDGGHPFWQLSESTAYKVLAVADCPVFAIRRSRFAREKVKANAVHALTAIG